MIDCLGSRYVIVQLGLTGPLYQISVKIAQEVSHVSLRKDELLMFYLDPVAGDGPVTTAFCSARVDGTRACRVTVSVAVILQGRRGVGEAAAIKMWIT